MGTAPARYGRRPVLSSPAYPLVPGGRGVLEPIRMAFNPFDVFRRNQRILFAGMTVVIMFTFVLSFGKGDFFQMVPAWLASRQKTG